MALLSHAPTFPQLKKLSRQDCEGGPHYRLVLLGDCAIQHLAAGYARYTGLNLDVFDADYNQLDAQIMDPASEMYGFKAWLIKVKEVSGTGELMSAEEYRALLEFLQNG